MTLSFDAVRPIPIAVAAVSAFLVGGIWYGAIFGRRWATLHGYAAERLGEMGKTQGLAFGLMFLGDILAATGVAVFVGSLNARNALEGAGVGALVWIGVALAEAIMQNAAHRKPVAAFALDTVHQLIYLMVIGAILGAFAPAR